MGTGFSFVLPESIRSSKPEGQPVQVALADGRPLPSWLRFVPAEMRFVANAVPDSALPIQVVLMLGGQRIVVVVSERTE